MTIQLDPQRGAVPVVEAAASETSWETSPVRQVLSVVTRPGRYRVLEARGAQELPATTADVLLCTPGDPRAPQLSPAGRRMRAACVLAGVAHDVAVMPAPDLFRALAAAGTPWVAARSGRPLAEFGTWLVALDQLTDLPALLQLCTASGVPAEAARRAGRPRLILTGPAALWQDVISGLADGTAMGDPEAWDLPAVLRGETGGDDIALLPRTLPFAPREWQLPLVDTADDTVLLELARGCALGLATCGLAGGHACPPRHADLSRTGARAAGAIEESGTDRLLLRAGPVGSIHALEQTLLDIERQILGRGVAVSLDDLDPRDVAAQSWSTLARLGCRVVRLAPLLALEADGSAAGAGSPLTMGSHAALVLDAVESAIAAGIRQIVVPVIVGFPGIVAVSGAEWAAWTDALALAARRAPQAVRVTLEILATAPEPLAPWPLGAWPAAEDVRALLRDAGEVATHKSLRVVTSAAARAAAETRVRRAGAGALRALAAVAASRTGPAAPPVTGPREERDASWDEFPSLAPHAGGERAWRLTPREPDWIDPVPPGATLGVASAQQFGRRKRRDSAVEGTMLKWRLQFTKEAEARFAGHLDIGRVFDRALRRAQIPLAFSKGHTPRPRIAYGPPLPLGMTSQAEYLDLELREPFRGDIAATLSACLPRGIDVVTAVAIPGACDSLTASIDVAVYVIASRVLPAIATAAFQDAGASFHAASQYLLARKSGDAPVNVRPSVLDFVLDETGLTLVVRLSHTAAVRPDVLVAALLGEAGPGDPRLIPVHRQALLIALPNRRITPLEAVRASSAQGYGKLAEEGWGPLHAS